MRRDFCEIFSGFGWKHVFFRISLRIVNDFYWNWSPCYLFEQYNSFLYNYVCCNSNRINSNETLANEAQKCMKCTFWFLSIDPSEDVNAFQLSKIVQRSYNTQLGLLLNLVRPGLLYVISQSQWSMYRAVSTDYRGYRLATTAECTLRNH